MAWTTPRTWSAGETVTAQLMNGHVRDNMNVLKVSIGDDGKIPGASVPQSKGGTIASLVGLDNTALNLIVWRAPYACTVTAVKGYRVGGSGATINARKNGSSNHLSGALSLTSADQWMDGGTVQNTSYAAGDKLEIMVVTAVGSPTQISIQVDFIP